MVVTQENPPQEVLDALMESNAAFASGKATGDMISSEAGIDARKQLESGQAPVACIVSCADSRVPPEVIFQKGLGQLFVVRTAGNRADDAAILGSVQYAVCHLGVKLVIVLGHSSCGAIAAAINASKGTYPPEDEAALNKYLESLVPFIKTTLESAPGEDANATCCDANIRNVVKGLEADPSIAARKPMIAGARYGLDSGVVQLV